MSSRIYGSIRSMDSLVHQAVYLALEQDKSIKNMYDVVLYQFPPGYVLQDKATNESFFIIEPGDRHTHNSIIFFECSKNSPHPKYYPFYKYDYKKFQMDTDEDQQQIQDLANIIIEFCRQRRQN